MPNKLILWGEIPPALNQKYSIVQILDDADGLRLKLIGNDNLEYVLDYTNCGVCMYRSYSDSFYYTMIEEYVEQKTIANATFFEVRSSDEIEKLGQWGFGDLFEKAKPLHLMLFADTSVFETVSCGSPELRLA